MPYELHPSKRLKTCFLEKPWQGADPFSALFLFVGLDANYDRNIDETLPEVFQYLEDGVSFWRQHGKGIHHPFRLPHYKGSGKRYHDQFAKIGFTPQHAALVSFIELLHLPTTGRSNLTLSDLSPTHISFLDRIFANGTAKHIFMPSSVTRLMRRTKAFPWLPMKALKKVGDIPVLYEKEGRMVYEIYHFSCYGWQSPMLNRQISQITAIAQSIL